MGTLQVHLGPGEAFAILGTISGGQEVDIMGRDLEGDWLAIRFPPGSTARGWIPSAGLSGLQGLTALEIVQPTPLATGSGEPPDPTSTSGTSSFFATATSEPGTSEGSLIPTATSTPARTPTVGAPDRPAGSPDLAVTRISLLGDGSIQVTVGNRGPGDLGNYAVFVVVTAGAQSETLRAPNNIEVGETFTVVTSSIQIAGETDVVAIVDPGQAVPDGNRSNNTSRSTLTPTSESESES